MTATLFLHIGINETGSPDIQRWLATNQSALLQRGLLYPVTGRTENSHDVLAKISTPRVNEHSPETPEIDVSRLLSLRDGLREEISNSGARQVIVSSEEFAWLTDLNPVQDLFRNMQVRVVIYLRRHDLWWESMYRQSIARQCANGAPEALEPGFLPFVQHFWETRPEAGPYRPLVERWAAAFGKPNIIICPCTEIPETSVLITDFLQATGSAEYASGLSLKADAAPPPLSRRQLQLLEIFLRVRTSPGLRQRLLQHTIESASTPDPFYFHAPLQRRVEFINKNLKSYQFIAREFMNREDGQLFAKLWPSAQDPWEPECAMTAVECAEEVIKALTATDPVSATRPGLLARLLFPR